VVKKTRSAQGLAGSSRGPGTLEGGGRLWRGYYYDVEEYLRAQVVEAEKAKRLAERALKNFMAMKRAKDGEDGEDGDEEEEEEEEYE
jgi:hypothetical protein